MACVSYVTHHHGAICIHSLHKATGHNERYDSIIPIDFGCNATKPAAEPNLCQATLHSTFSLKHTIDPSIKETQSVKNAASKYLKCREIAERHLGSIDGNPVQPQCDKYNPKYFVSTAIHYIWWGYGKGSNSKGRTRG